MSRTKVFVSYSHRDREWLDRLRVHLAILERRSIVHVWSDARLESGVHWQQEIERALGESLAAVLLITPYFLASDYIWREEMPRILAHAEQGMLLFPLIAKPCAWRIAPELAELQARPLDGRALSLGTEAELDRDLAEFVYELSQRLQQMPAAIASNELDLMRSDRRSTRTRAASMEPGRPAAGVRRGHPLRAGQSWTGIYLDTNRQLRLTIAEVKDDEFRASMEYRDDGSLTEVEGRILTNDDGSGDDALKTILPRVPGSDARVIFRETRVSKPGKRSVDLQGEYRAVTAGGLMLGVWVSNGQPLGEFQLERAD